MPDLRAPNPGNGDPDRRTKKRHSRSHKCEDWSHICPPIRIIASSDSIRHKRNLRSFNKIFSRGFLRLCGIRRGARYSGFRIFDFRHTRSVQRRNSLRVEPNFVTIAIGTNHAIRFSHCLKSNILNRIELA